MNIFYNFSVGIINIMFIAARVQNIGIQNIIVLWHFLLTWFMIEIRYIVIYSLKRKFLTNLKKIFL